MTPLVHSDKAQASGVTKGFSNSIPMLYGEELDRIGGTPCVLHYFQRNLEMRGVLYVTTFKLYFMASDADCQVCTLLKFL